MKYRLILKISKLAVGRDIPVFIGAKHDFSYKISAYITSLRE